MYARAVAFVRADDLFSVQPFPANVLTPETAGKFQESYEHSTTAITTSRRKAGE